MLLDLSTREEGGATVVSLSGRLTQGPQLSVAESRLKALFQPGPMKVVLDLARLDYLDSTGIGLLMACASAARNHQGQFHVAGPNARVLKIFEIAHVGTAVPVYPDVAGAIGAFA